MRFTPQWAVTFILLIAYTQGKAVSKGLFLYRVFCYIPFNFLAMFDSVPKLKNLLVVQLVLQIMIRTNQLSNITFLFPTSPFLHIFNYWLFFVPAQHILQIYYEIFNCQLHCVEASLQIEINYSLFSNYILHCNLFIITYFYGLFYTCCIISKELSSHDEPTCHSYPSIIQMMNQRKPRCFILTHSPGQCFHVVYLLKTPENLMGLKLEHYPKMG